MTHATEDTRRRLLEAAGEVFAEKGFRATTFRDICGRAEANLAAVNYYFGDKEQLYVEAVQHAHHSRDSISHPQWSSDTPPATKLRHYIRRMLTRLLDERRPSWHAQLMAREMTNPTNACRALVESYIRSDFEVLDGILRELLPSDTSDADRHLVAFSVVGQCLHFKIHRPIAILLVGDEETASHDIDRLTEHVAHFSLAALGKQPPVCGRTCHQQSQSPCNTVDNPT